MNVDPDGPKLTVTVAGVDVELPLCDWSDGEYEPETLAVPVVVGVKSTLQLDVVKEPIGERMQLTWSNEPIVPVWEKETVPAGGIGFPTLEESVTIAVHCDEE